MVCLRCGYCCQVPAIVIVDDPERGIVEDNLKPIGFHGPERCPHLVGDKCGNYSCEVHEYSWYKKTPCASHGQIERHPTDNCRMGEYLINREQQKKP